MNRRLTKLVLSALLFSLSLHIFAEYGNNQSVSKEVYGLKFAAAERTTEGQRENQIQHIVSGCRNENRGRIKLSDLVSVHP